jgi:hypothetical protein
VAAPGVSAASALRLATLGERIAKLHAQVGQGILVERSKRALSETFSRFETVLHQVGAAASGTEIHENYLLLGMLWREYRDMAARPSSRESGVKVRERCEEVVWIAAKGSRLIQDAARDAQSAWALRASQASLLSQRIPKLHLWRRWQLEDEAAKRELRESEENLARTLAALHEAPGLEGTAITQLQSAESQLSFMLGAARELAKGAPAAKQLEFIAKTGDHILEATEQLRVAFEAQPAS